MLSLSEKIPARVAAELSQRISQVLKELEDLGKSCQQLSKDLKDWEPCNRDLTPLMLQTLLRSQLLRSESLCDALEMYEQHLLSTTVDPQHDAQWSVEKNRLQQKHGGT